MDQVGASFPLKEACELLKSPKHTDFTLVCEGCHFPVHRIILYQKSPFFRAAFDHEFKEKSDGQMTIGDTTPEALAATIIFCYSDKLALFSIHDTFPIISRKHDPMESGVRREYLMDIYLLADRLLLPSLARKAATAFIEDIESVPKENLTRFIVETYDRMPAGDDILKPLVTAWATSRFNVLNLDCYDEEYEVEFDNYDDYDTALVRDTILQEDHGGFVAATFINMKWKGGVSSKEAAKKTLTTGLLTYADLP